MSSYAESGRAPRTLTEREQRLLLKITGEHRAGFRDHVLYAMALGTGLREHELVGLNVGDVFDAGGKARRRTVPHAGSVSRPAFLATKTTMANKLVPRAL